MWLKASKIIMTKRKAHFQLRFCFPKINLKKRNLWRWILEMHCTSIAPWHVCCDAIPKHFFFHHLSLTDGRPVSSDAPISIRIHCTSNFSLTLTAADGCSKRQEKRKNRPKPTSPPNHKQAYCEESYTSVDHKKAINQTKKGQHQGSTVARGTEAKNRAVILANMWWPGFKAALGQRINIAGIVSFVGVVARDRHLAIPHVTVPDIRYIDWPELKRKGFQGVVFDKDNTITVPYSLSLWSPLGSSVESCKSEFTNHIAVFSNSAGLSEYDPDGRKAKALESAIGIKVIKHRVKKPAGTAEEIERHFGCQSSRLVMVGDRPFTDVVYGNRNGFLTILTEPLSHAEEPFIVRQVRKLEVAIVNRWSRKGIKPFTHKLFPDAQQCVKDLPHL